MLKRRLQRLDASYPSDDARRQARTLRGSLLALALGAAAYLPVYLLILRQPLTPLQLAGTVLVVVVLVVSARLLSAGKLGAARWVFALGLWLGLSAWMLLAPGDLWGAGAAALVLAVALSVVALPARGGVLLTVLYALSTAAVGAAAFYGWLPGLSPAAEVALWRPGLVLVAELVTGFALSAASRQASQTVRRVDSRARDLESLLRIGGQAAASLQLDEMLDAVVRELHDAFDCAQVQVLLVDGSGEFAELRAAAGHSELQVRAGMHHLRLNADTTAGQVVSGRAPVLNGSSQRRGSTRVPAMHAELALPIMHQGDVLGVLNLRSTDPDAFSAAMADVLGPFCTQLGGAIYNAQTFETEAALLEVTSPVFLAARRIVAAAEPDDIVSALRENIAAWADDIILAGAGQRTLDHAASWRRGGTPPAVNIPPRLLTAAREAGGLLVVEPGALADGHYEAIAGPLGAESLVLLALRARQRTVGLLVLAASEVHTHTEHELQALEVLADPIAAALDNWLRVASLEASAGESRALYEALREMSAAGRLEDVYASALREVTRLTGADRALLFLAGPDPHTDCAYVERAAVWQDGRTVALEASARYPNVDAPAVWQIPLSREARVFNNVQHDDRLVRELRAEYRRRGVNALAALPLVADETWLGALVIEAQRGQAFDEQVMSAAQGIVEAAARLIDLNRTLFHLERAAERERMVGHITEELERAPNLSLLLESATRQLAEVLGTDHVYAEIDVTQVAGGATSNGHQAAEAAEGARTQQ